MKLVPSARLGPVAALQAAIGGGYVAGAEWRVEARELIGASIVPTGELPRAVLARAPAPRKQLAHRRSDPAPIRAFDEMGGREVCSQQQRVPEDKGDDGHPDHQRRYERRLPRADADAGRVARRITRLEEAAQQAPAEGRPGDGHCKRRGREEVREKSVKVEAVEAAHALAREQAVVIRVQYRVSAHRAKARVRWERPRRIGGFLHRRTPGIDDDARHVPADGGAAEVHAAQRERPPAGRPALGAVVGQHVLEEQCEPDQADRAHRHDEACARRTRERAAERAAAEGGEAAEEVDEKGHQRERDDGSESVDDVHPLNTVTY
mmetsp:Transcript_34046/g.84909  ORF Transcript_34046/g.84909 Transcript_34046/m.84909 type:complete len:321 (+) Transcript_34046:243-1205(+)